MTRMAASWILAWAALGSIAAAAPRPMVPEDTYRIRAITEIEIAPDGRTVVYAIETADERADVYTHALWETTIDGGEPKRLTPEGLDAVRPRFSSDGRWIAFVGTEDAAPQLWVQRTGTKRARRVTSFEEGVAEFSWAPDGRRIVVTRTDALPSGYDEDDPIVVTRTQIQRDGMGYLDDRRQHLWIVPLDGGPATRLTSGAWDAEQPAWAPDGKSIAFVANRAGDPDATDDTDIWVIRPDGSGLRPLASNPGPDENPTWSRRGDRLAFVGKRRPNDPYQISRLMVVPASGGTPSDLSGRLDTWVASDSLWAGGDLARIHWSPDDATLYTTFERRGATWLGAVPSVAGETREVLSGPFVVDLARLLPDGSGFVVARQDPTHPPELHIVRADGSAARRISRINDALLAGLRLSSPTKLAATNAEGQAIEAWLYPPVDLDRAKRYPLILYIHGGPQAFDGDYFAPGLEPQVFAGLGWAVLRVNYRGSTSYGEAFCRAPWGDWHRREHDDLMAALDEALKQPWIDPDRLGIGGWSYGGIQTIWAVAHTGRFRVGVPERFEIDYLSAFGQDQWFAQYLAEFGSPLDNEAAYRRISPGSYVGRIGTPLYLIANEADGNCPLPQAMQLYQRLKLLGIPTQLVVYPGEPHVLTRPRHAVDRLHRLAGWFGTHLKRP